MFTLESRNEESTMPAIRVSTRRGITPTPPRHPDGTLYQYELIDPDDRWRAYADEPADLVAELIPGYAEAGEADRAAARVSLAERLRAAFQAELLAVVDEDEDEDELTEQQRLAFNGAADPAAITQWTGNTPLVLLEGAYAPAGTLPRPVAEPPAEILWIDPLEDGALLSSLHYLGLLVLAERVAEDESRPGV
jgi:hypothetical protein